jgi:fatty-acyl-CoA synthase
VSPEAERLIKDQFSIDWLDYHGRYDSKLIAAVDVDTGRRITYGEFNDRIHRLASGLAHEFGVSKGDRIALIAHNSAGTFESLFAGWQLGAALMPLNWRLSPGEISRLLEHADPAVVIYDEEFSSLVETHKGPTLTRRREQRDSCDYEALIRSGMADVVPAELTIDDMATLLYTSGTTGQPKGVIGTFRMMRDTIIHAALHAGLHGASRALTSAPMFHSAGLYGFSMPIFHYGGTLYIMKRWDPARYLELMTDPDLGITHTIGVPVQYAMIAELPEFRDASFPTLQVAGVGAAPVPDELLDVWAEKGVNLATVYGLTEAFSVCYLPPQTAREKPGSVGHRMMHTRLKVADAEGERVKPGVVGEIMIKGPAVTPGYWKAPDETEAAFLDGWFKTGDAGRIDDEGSIYIVGRYKDVFISGGENVYPAEIENILDSLDGVLMAAVVGVPDPKWGEVGLAVIQARPDSALDEAAITTYLQQHLAGFKVPKHVVFVDEIPVSAQGKVQKDELKRRHAP